MSKTKSEHTVETAFGPATIETYECDSCGNEVAYENTVPFTIGSTEGRACEHCEQNGPISFPKRVVDWSLPYQSVNRETHGLATNVFLAPLWVVVLTMAGFTGGANQFVNGYATAVVSLLVWVGIPLVLFGVVL